ncbi:MAG TPA: acyltransferase [Segeticoccus sp.]|nr:acyltransferase [Segeticoccus sp.]
MLRTGQLMLGRGTFLGANVHIRCEGDGRMLIGQDVTMNLGASASAERHVTIGDHVLIGPGTYITDGNHVFSDVDTPVPDQGMTCKGPTVIEDNVWLGAHVVVTSGVRIGRRSVVGANSVVTRDIPPFCVAVGAPARVCRRLDGRQHT